MTPFSEQFESVLYTLRDQDVRVAQILCDVSYTHLNLKRMHYIMINLEDNNKLNFMKQGVSILNEDGTLNTKGLNSGKVIRVLRTLLENINDDYELTDRDYELFLQSYKREILISFDEDDFKLYSGDMIDEGYCQDNYQGFQSRGDIEKDLATCDHCGEIRDDHVNECTCYEDPNDEIRNRYSETSLDCVIRTVTFERSLFTEDDYDCDEVGYTLGSSCMRYYRCIYDNYFQIYKDNAKLLVHFDKYGHIKARAIIWYNVINVKTNEVIDVFMDRIYAVDEEAEDLMVGYAKNQKWAYKSEQSAYSKRGVYLYNEKAQTYYSASVKMKIKIPFVEYSTAPYMDTFSRLHMNREGLWLYNELESDENTPVYDLSSTDGIVDYSRFKKKCEICKETIFMNVLQPTKKDYLVGSVFTVSTQIVYKCDACASKTKEYAIIPEIHTESEL